MTLHDNIYQVLLIGRRLKKSLLLEPRSYSCKRFKLIFEKGPLFYVEFNIRLFFFLLFTKADILLANDLDTLLPNFLISKIKGIPIIYDNHEYYTGVPELQQRPFVRKIWKSIEKYIFPKLKYVYTVNRSIADLYQNEYEIKVEAVRNLPLLIENIETDRPKEFPSDKSIILYQGAGINIERGVEEAIEAMTFIEHAILVIIGGGDVIERLRIQVFENKLGPKVVFIPKLPFKELKKYTQFADIGLSLDKDTNINYRFSLPNKLFDYIHAGVPVLASPLPEVKKIVENYHVGTFIESHSPSHIAQKIKEMLNNKALLKQYKENCLIASKELNWQNEEKVILKIFSKL